MYPLRFDCKRANASGSRPRKAGEPGGPERSHWRDKPLLDEVKGVVCPSPNDCKRAIVRPLRSVGRISEAVQRLGSPLRRAIREGGNTADLSVRKAKMGRFRCRVGPSCF